MSRARAVHLTDPDAVLVTRAARALCRRDGVLYTTTSAEVTCADCLRLTQQKARTGQRAVQYEEALLEVARLIAGPPVERAPELTPELWARMRCRIAVARGEHSSADETELWSHAVAAQALRSHCRCEVCCVDLNNARTKYEWEVEQDLRPHRKHEFEFGSARAALELLARWQKFGAATRSSLGSAQARAEETARLGTAVQTTRYSDRDALELRRAVMATDIMRACRRAFAEEQERRGLPVEVCVLILLDSVSEGKAADWWAEHLGLTERAIRALIRHGMKAVKVELAVGEYMPRPHARDGLDGAIDRRAEEVRAQASAATGGW